MIDNKWLEFIFVQNSIKHISHDRPYEIYVYAEDYPDKIILYFYDNSVVTPENYSPLIFEKSLIEENT